MVRLILVRHGKTEWNESGRYQGSSDVGLSATGFEEAEGLRQRLADEKIDIIYCSDLKRASQTAQAIASGRNLELVPCKELREIDFGEFEGLTFDEVERRYPDIHWWQSRDADKRLPQGESISQLAARVERFIAGNLARHHNGETVLVVAHGGTLRVLICHLLNLSLEHWWQLGLDSASISVIETYHERIVLSLLNDVCHLGSLRKASPW